jgi:hypothetical protein
VFDNGTNVGIGTATPSGNLEVFNNSTGGNLRLSRDAGAQRGVLEWGRNNGGSFQGVASIVAESDLTSPNNGLLRFITSNSSGTQVDRMRLDASGNLGLGVTPSAWGSGYKVLQMGAGSVASFGTTFMEFGQNTFYDNSYKYVNNGFATNYYQNAGGHFWFTAPSGTAGNVITFTQAMTLGANGNLLLNTTTDNGARLQVSGSGTFSSSVTAATTISARQGWTSAGINAAPYFDEAIILGQSGNQSKIQYGNSFSESNGTWLRFVVNSNSAANTPVNALTLRYDGAATFSSLAGTGTRVVEASSAGLLSATKVIDAGTYTPTLSNTFNITSSALVTGSAIKYIRVGNIVTVTGRATVTPTTANFVTLTLSLPISSTSSDVGMVIGTASNTIEGGIWGTVSPSTNSAFINFYNSLVTAYDIYFSFTYQVQ